MGYFSLETQELTNTLMLPILALLGLPFAVGIDPYVKKPEKRVVLLIDALVLTVILAKRKFRIRYIPITFRPRQGGTNTINMKRIFRIGREAVRSFLVIRRNL